MPHDTRLLQIDAEELLSEIRTRVDGDLSLNGHVGVVQFYPLLPDGSSLKSSSELSDENFCEDVYLQANPDIAEAVRRGDLQSGFEHWIKHGKYEGRAFRPVEFNEREYLAAHPEVAQAIQSGGWASGRDHWLQCGRLKGLRIGKPLPMLVPRLKSLDIELHTCLSQIGEPPPVPATVRGTLGRWVIGGMRRMLWWYTRPLTIFAGVIERHLSEQTALFEQLGNSDEEHHRSISSLRESLIQVKADAGRLATALAEEKAAREALEQRLVEQISQKQAAETARIDQNVGQLESRVHQSYRRIEEKLAGESAAREALERRLLDEISQKQAAETARIDQNVGQLKIGVHESFRGIEEKLAEERAAREAMEPRLLGDFAQKQAAETSRLDQRVDQLEISIRESYQQIEAGLAREMGTHEAVEQRLMETISHNQAAETARLDQQVGQFEIEIRESYQRMEAGLAREMAAHEALEQRLAKRFSQNQAAETARLDQKVGQFEIGVQESCQRIGVGLAAEMAAREALAQRLVDALEELRLLQANWTELQRYSEQTKAELQFQSGRVAMLLQEARRCLPKPFGQEQLERLAATADHTLDALYVSFEDTFRGPRLEIKQRQSEYLPFLTAAKVGTGKRPILDLGAGRGEWLELLRDHQLSGQGVDRNRAMVELCQARGLDVAGSDALNYLRSLQDSSFGAVTSFHMIEHLPFTTVIALLEESLRVLQPGGLLILETPNPTNLMVASHNFYLDPTHIRPLPAVMMRFFVEAAGFCNTQVLELHPYPPALIPPTPESDAASKRLNSLLYGPQDYGIIAQRP